MKRLRLVKLLVQPVVMIDDGEFLTETETSTVTIDAADVADFPAWLAERLAEQQAQLNASSSAGYLAMTGDRVGDPAGAGASQGLAEAPAGADGLQADQRDQ